MLIGLKIEFVDGQRIGSSGQVLKDSGISCSQPPFGLSRKTGRPQDARRP
jgi:hypothetical protein